MENARKWKTRIWTVKSTSEVFSEVVVKKHEKGWQTMERLKKLSLVGSNISVFTRKSRIYWDKTCKIVVEKRRKNERIKPKKKKRAKEKERSKNARIRELKVRSNVTAKKNVINQEEWWRMEKVMIKLLIRFVMERTSIN